MLREILRRALKPGRKLAFAGFLAFVGVSLLLGDGVITPAITLLSAVEGIVLVPGLENERAEILMLIAVLIAIGIFSIQSRGVDKVAGIFGPIMAVWFSCLAITGLVSIAAMPGILKAVNPYYAFAFLSENGWRDFSSFPSHPVRHRRRGPVRRHGHLGRKPILHAWYFVFGALLLNYMGQGVFAVHHPDVKYLLFGMVQHQASFLYVPFLLLTFLATIIASQSIHQRNLFHRLPGHHDPHPAADEGGLHVKPDQIADPHSVRELGVDGRGHFYDPSFPEIGESRRGLRHGGDRIHDHHRSDDHSYLLAD
jgi:KUP system potassium uptake protein